MRLRPARLKLVVRILWSALLAVTAIQAMAVPMRTQELAEKVSSSSRILLDMQRCEISVVLEGRMRGFWLVAVGGTRQDPYASGGICNFHDINQPH